MKIWNIIKEIYWVIVALILLFVLCLVARDMYVKAYPVPERVPAGISVMGGL